VNTPGEAVAEAKAEDLPCDLETVFCAQYERLARLIDRVVRDRGRAEELAVEVFLKLSRNRKVRGENTEGWLYRVAVRMALDELRRQSRWRRYQHLLSFVRDTPTPEEIHASIEERDRVRSVLSAIPTRHAELLLLRSQDLSYGEMAVALNRNPASIGTLLKRSQQVFRKEYIKRYGEQ
jgi:RNA polymerase sigma-70 factor (ECF subfamily)